MALQGRTYTFVIISNPKQGVNEEPYLFFISDLLDARAIANHYLKRWKIECCFKHLKRNGFNVEDINLKADEKIELMMGVLAYTFLIAVIEGITKQMTLTIKLKNYKGGSSYPRISIFRCGYIELQRIFINIGYVIKHLKKLLSSLLIRNSSNKDFQNV